jgi:hypothetical protein
MHVSNSHSERAPRSPAPAAELPQSGCPEVPVENTLASDGCLARPAQLAAYFVEPTRLAPDPVDEGEARLILEMHYQEHIARRALEDLFESGQAQFLSI